LLSPEDLLAMPDGDRYELVDGRLVEHPMGAQASYVGRRLSTLLGTFCEANRLGWVLAADCGYQCFPNDAKLVRRPDVSFIRLGRLPGEQVPAGYITIPPDLAVEILSPNDLDYETDQKVERYLAAGVPLVWVMNPETHTVLIYRADGSIQGLREPGELSGEAVIPGFRCRVRDIFATPFADEPNPTAGA
jgi:Uma2 family endonuclease